MRYYVVSDLHGFYEPTMRALSACGFFEDRGPRKLVVCGDLFDRGKEAVKIQKWIADLLKRDEAILIRGNHEDLIEELVEHLEDWMNEALPYSHHVSNGTVDTLLQLTGMDLYEVYTRPAAARARMHRTPLFREILPAMRDWYETEHYVFVHGWIPAQPIGSPYAPVRFLPVGDWRRSGREAWERARWYNGMLAWSCNVREPSKTIVCGHYHASYGHAHFEKRGSEDGADAVFTPFFGEGIAAIDACIAYSGFVNCFVAEDA